MNLCLLFDVLGALNGIIDPAYSLWMWNPLYVSDTRNHLLFVGSVVAGSSQASLICLVAPTLHASELFDLNPVFLSAC
jgi:hypothetical protein